MALASTHYVVVLASLARQCELDVDALLVEVGIPPALAESPDQWLDNDYLTALVKALWRETNDETMGIDPDLMRMGTWALACDYMLVAETLGDLYRRGERIYDFLPPASMSLGFSSTADSVTVRINCYEGVRDPHHFLVEFLSVVWHRFPCWAIDEYIPVQQAFFRYPEPPHAWVYEELLQCAVLFDQPHNGFTFSKKYLSKPITRSNRELEAWLRSSPADLLYLPARDTTVNTYIRQQLMRELRAKMQFPSFDDICESLHMSSQVVRRRLAEEGTSYQKIKDGVRSELIKDLLAKPEIAIADIAQRAGFTEPAALSRAFKKWTGLTPAQYREQRTSKPPT
ncbi:MAG: AraC family transcriptional regulator [Halioglobus sp.]